MFIGKQPARMPHPGLNFVQNQQRIVPVAQTARRLQIFRSGGQDAAFALYRLDDDRAGLFADGSFQRGNIVERNVRNALRQRCIILTVFRLSADGHGKQRASVETVDTGDDFAFASAETVARIFPCQL